MGWENPNAPGGFALFGDLQKNVMIPLVLVGLCCRYRESDTAIQFAHGEFGNLPHGGIILLDANQKVRIGLFDTVGQEIIRLISPVCNNQRGPVKAVAFQHLYQRADFVLARFRLNDRIEKRLVA